MHAIAESSEVWYSMVYGDYEDNVVGVTLRHDLRHEETHPLQQGGPLARAAGDLVHILERPMPVDLRRRILEGESPLTLPDVRDVVSVHDDCFFHVQPADPVRIKRMILSALSLHSHFQGREIDWSAALTPIQELLTPGISVMLTSLPTKNILLVRAERRREQLGEWVLDLVSGPEREMRIPIRGSTAVAP
jgi:hypothetical protein